MGETADTNQNNADSGKVKLKHTENRKTGLFPKKKTENTERLKHDT